MPAIAGWRTVRFGDVVRNVDEAVRDPFTSDLERFVGLEHIDPESLRIKRWGLIADGTSFTRKFSAGQVLFGKRRAYQRKVAVADFDGLCSSDILVFEPADDQLLPELLPFIVQTEGFFQHALGTSAGSLSPRTRWRDLAAYEFPLPSLDEQRRIAEILWAAEETAHSYLEVSENLDRLRRVAIITLLGVQDQTECSRIVKGEAEVTSRGWPICTIGGMAPPNRKGVQVGPFGSSVSSRHFTTTGTLVLKINNLTDAGGLDLSEMVFIADEYAATLTPYRIVEGDLVTAAQATTGRSALVSLECEGAIISQHLIRVAIDRSRCLPEYLLACFLSPLILQQITAVKQKTTRDGLNTADVESFRIPLPALDEQEKVVQALSHTDEASKVLFRLVQDKERMRKALLSTLLP